MSEQQQAVRHWVRSNWRGLLDEVVEETLGDAQEEDSAARLAGRLWPELPARGHDPPRPGRPVLPTTGIGRCPGGLRHAPERPLGPRRRRTDRGRPPRQQVRPRARFSEVVRQEVEAGSDIGRAIDQAFRQRDSDDFTRPVALRELVLRRLSSLAAGELSGLAGDGDEDGPKRRLKVLTALSTPGGTHESRAQVLQAIKTGRTAAFPFVLKYVGPDAFPAIQGFDGHQPPTLDGFSPEILGKFPAADLVRDCLHRYASREAVLTRLMDPDGPITGGLTRAFGDLDAFVPRRRGGVFVPKATALAEGRRDRFRIPDGIACALGVATLLESLLRQVAFAKGLGRPRRTREGARSSSASAATSRSPREPPRT